MKVPPPHSTIEEMLVVCRQCGIDLNEGMTIEDLTSDWSREQIESDGFKLLLVALGGECAEPTYLSFSNGYIGEPLIQRLQYSWRSLSNDVWHLDYECISSLEDYYGVVDRLTQLTRGALVLAESEHLLDFQSGQAWVDLGLTEKPLRPKWNNDWLDPAIIYACNDRLIGLGSPKRFAAQSTGQSNIIICQTPDRIESLNRATGLRFAQQYD